MTVTRDTLIAAYPEFSDLAVYPQTQIDFWIGQPPNQINLARFGDSADLAVILFVAHHISLSAMATREAKGGDVIGIPSGLVTSESVDKVSASYDVNLTAVAGAGPWNATVYGQRYYALLKAFATGPIYRLPTAQRGLYAGLRRF